MITVQTPEGSPLGEPCLDPTVKRASGVGCWSTRHCVDRGERGARRTWVGCGGGQQVENSVEAKN